MAEVGAGTASVWDIDRARVGAVLRSAITEVKQYQQDSRSYGIAFDDVLEVLGHSDAVANRLAGYAKECAIPDVRGVLGHSSSAILGTAEAVRAYGRGDAKMRDTAQRNAARAQYPSMPGPSRPAPAHPSSLWRRGDSSAPEHGGAPPEALRPGDADPSYPIQIPGTNIRTTAGEYTKAQGVGHRAGQHGSGAP